MSRADQGLASRGITRPRKWMRTHLLTLLPEETELLAELAASRPETRADCEAGERPCPFLSCRHHLYLDVDAKTGSIKQNFPDLELHQLAETCALDVADRQGVTLEEVGSLMNLTRERIRQLEAQAITRIAAAPEVA